MSQHNVRFKDKPNGEKPTVFFITIPCKTVTNEHGESKKLPQRPIVQSALAMSHMFPHSGSGMEIIYTLSNGKLKNDKALFASREEAERECEEILEMLRKAEAGVKSKDKSKSGENA